jgi:hypothetical protein
MDSLLYRDRLPKPIIVLFWKNMCQQPWDEIFLQADGAPGHKKYAKEYREEKEVDILEWIAQSPDLNPQEDLWSDMDCYLGLTYGRIGNVELLMEKAREAWNYIPKERLRGLIDGMHDRLVKVIEAKGRPTRTFGHGTHNKLVLEAGKSDSQYSKSKKAISTDLELIVE